MDRTVAPVALQVRGSTHGYCRHNISVMTGLAAVSESRPIGYVVINQIIGMAGLAIGVDGVLVFLRVITGTTMTS